MAYATLAGGCFWCMVKPFTSYPGIEDVVSGYSGGNIENPTYEQVCSNQTGHREAVQITYNPDITSFENILMFTLNYLTRQIIKGNFLIEAKAMNQQYFIMMNNKKAAELKIQQLNEEGIFKNQSSHQFFLTKTFIQRKITIKTIIKNPMHYEQYQRGSGRKAFIESHWGLKMIKKIKAN